MFVKIHGVQVIGIATLIGGVLLRPAVGQMPTIRVVVGEARIVEASPTMSLVGTVEPALRSRVSSELAGLIVDMPAREGDVVQSGGLICKLNDDTLILKLAAERAQLDVLLSRHEELLAGTRKEELVRLKALLDEAVTEFDRRRFDMQRIEKLYADRDSNDKEFQDTRADFLAAERRKIAANAAYNLGLEGPRKERIAQAAHGVARQRALADRVASDLRKTLIRAPFDGHIVRRTVEIGEWISEGDTVVEMVDLRTVLVRVDVPETVLSYVHTGDSVRVTVDAVGRFFKGRIKNIMRQADLSARTFPVDIEVDNSDEALAGGMFARCTLPAGPIHETVAVPQDAIVMRDGITYVAMIMPSRQGGTSAMLSPVSVGIDIGELVTITSGNLPPGTTVITRGTELIPPFPMPVEIVDERGTPVAMPVSDKKKPPTGDA